MSSSTSSSSSSSFSLQHSTSISHHSSLTNTSKVRHSLLVKEQEEEYAEESFEEEEETLEIFQVHDRVQVFWEEENTWFDGKVVRLDDKMNRIFVLYDDGDEAYENPQNIRLVPPLPAKNTSKNLVQLQKDQHLISNLELCMHHQVFVYWVEEKQWFSGRITQCNQQKQALQVTYDDGDVTWETCLHQMMIVIEEKTLKTSCVTAFVAPVSTGSAFKERILVPRKYTCVLNETTHFQPERIARPYRYQTVVKDHTSSIKTARSVYHERAYLHATGSSMESVSIIASVNPNCRKESDTQTDLYY